MKKAQKRRVPGERKRELVPSKRVKRMHREVNAAGGVPVTLRQFVRALAERPDAAAARTAQLWLEAKARQ